MAGVITQGDIDADIKKFVEIYCKTGAKIAGEEFEKRAKKAIQAFYNDYSPTWYKRTGNMMHSFKKYYHNNSDIIYGGVRISDEEMKSYGYAYKFHSWHKVPGPYYPYGQDNPGSILFGVWEVGDRVTARASWPPLWHLRRMTVLNHQLITSIKKRAMQAACSAGYSVIQPYMN